MSVNVTDGFVVTRYTVNNTDWTPLVATVDADYLGFQNINGVDMFARTDPADGNTEWPIPGGMQEGVMGPHMKSRTTRSLHRWHTDDVICYLKSAVPGSSIVVLKLF